jgi:hypothetical protein
LVFDGLPNQAGAEPAAAGGASIAAASSGAS